MKPIISLLVLALFPLQLWAAIQLIAEPGQRADDFPSGFIYWGVDTGSSAIGASGHVAFSGAVDIGIGSTENNTSAVWAGLPGHLKAIIRENESPVGFPDNVLFDSAAPAANIGNIVVTKSGIVGFPALLKGAVQRQRALLAHVNGTTLGIIREGDPAPGFPAGTFIQRITNFSLSDAGMVILAQLSGSSTTNFSVWFYDFTNFTLLSTPVDDCSFSLPPTSTSINDSGEIVFTAFLIANDGNHCSVPGGVFKWVNGTWETLITESDSIPSLDANFSLIGGFTPFMSPMINDQGDVAFSAISENFTSLKNKDGMWVKDGSPDPKLLVLVEETLKGNPDNIIADLQSFSFINTGFTNNGQSMLPIITTTGITALMTGNPRNTQPYSSLSDTGESQLNVIAQQNNQPPGFVPTWFYSWFLGQSLNRNGEFVYTSRVSNAIDNEEITAVWRGNSSGIPRLKAMEGMQVTVNGEERTLEQVFTLDSNKRNTTGKTFITTGGKTAHFSDNGHFLFDGTLSGGGNSVMLLLDDSREQRIFELAEQLFPQFFSPANAENRLFGGFEYRFYSDKNTYLGIKNNYVYLLGDVFGSGVIRFNTIDNTLQLLEDQAQIN